MKTIIERTKGFHISSESASSIATKAMAGEKEAMCLVVAEGASDLFIKRDKKIRRATDEEWENYVTEEGKFFRKAETVPQ
jgi:hypothetical protein